MRTVFDGYLNVKWHDPKVRLPLDEYKKDERNWGLITYVFVLINDEEDRNDDPEIVMLEFHLSHDGKQEWHWIGGGEYVECHRKNIKFWADVPNYEKTTVESFTRYVSTTCDKTCIEEGCDCEG